MDRMRGKVGRRPSGLQVLEVRLLRLRISGTGAPRDVDLETADVGLAEAHAPADESDDTRARVEGADRNERRHIGSAVVTEDQPGAGSARTRQQRQPQRPEFHLAGKPFVQGHDNAVADPRGGLAEPQQEERQRACEQPTTEEQPPPHAAFNPVQRMAPHCIVRFIDDTRVPGLYLATTRQLRFNRFGGSGSASWETAPISIGSRETAACFAVTTFRPHSRATSVTSTTRPDAKRPATRWLS